MLVINIKIEMTSTENRTDFGNKRLIREAFYLFNCTVETSKVNGKQKFIILNV